MELYGCNETQKPNKQPSTRCMWDSETLERIANAGHLDLIAGHFTPNSCIFGNMHLRE
jgi:hypothetical protein